MGQCLRKLIRRTSNWLRRGPTFECEICFETEPLHYSFNPKGCNHLYCTDCSVRYVESRLPQHSQILCPSPGCPGFLDPEHCRRILPPELVDRWGVSQVESAIDDSQKLYCPYADCSVLLINDDDDDGGCRPRRRWLLSRFWSSSGRKATCPWCNRELCVTCRNPWHSKTGCGTYRSLKDHGEEKLLTSLAKSNKWQRCPNCKIYVSKRDGCSHIACRCGADFCYACGARWSRSHQCSRSWWW